MTKGLDNKISKLATLEAKAKIISEEIETLRNEIFNTMIREGMDQYKNELATISKVERKSVKYADKPENIIKELEKENLVKYITLIPAKKELSKTFEQDLKEGKFTMKGVTIEVKTGPSIRFNKKDE